MRNIPDSGAVMFLRAAGKVPCEGPLSVLDN